MKRTSLVSHHSAKPPRTAKRWGGRLQMPCQIMCGEKFGGPVGSGNILSEVNDETGVQINLASLSIPV